MLMPDPRGVPFSSEKFVRHKSGNSEAFDEYGRRPWHADYNDKSRRESEWNTFLGFQGEYARLFGPKRRGISFEFGVEEKSEDDADFHAYHLSLEQRYKPKKINRRRRLIAIKKKAAKGRLKKKGPMK